jgi:hypothetical protein
MKPESFIFDFETLSLERDKCVVLSLATVSFDETRFVDNPYSWDELVNSAKMIKFDVTEQVEKYHRVIDKSTLEWWNSLPEFAKESSFHPKPDDQPLEAIYDFMRDALPSNLKWAYSRGNTFDPIVLDFVLKDINKSEMWPYYKMRDTRSFIGGLSYGVNLRDNFMPEGYEKLFVAHDPIHDIVIDVIRMQYLIQAISS